MVYEGRKGGNGSPRIRKKGEMVNEVRRPHCRYKSGLEESGGSPRDGETTVALWLTMTPRERGETPTILIVPSHELEQKVSFVIKFQ